MNGDVFPRRDTMLRLQSDFISGLLEKQIWNSTPSDDRFWAVIVYHKGR